MGCAQQPLCAGVASGACPQRLSLLLALCEAQGLSLPRGLPCVGGFRGQKAAGTGLAASPAALSALLVFLQPAHGAEC